MKINYNTCYFYVIDDSVCTCQATESNLELLEIVSMLTSKSISLNFITSDLESSIIDAKNSDTKAKRWSTDATLFN